MNKNYGIKNVEGWPNSACGVWPCVCFVVYGDEELILCNMLASEL